jgi:HD-GYP domain-containing protein (c-di-GMP phosphodiesterase class II)
MLDGTGYPDAISGDAISDVVRFLTVCDIYAALTEQRSYKAAMTSQDALKVLHGMAGKIEPRFVQAFERAVARAA